MDLAACISELQQVLKILKITGGGGGDSTGAKNIFSLLGSASSGGNSSSGPGTVVKPSMVAVARILKALFDLETAIGCLPLSGLGPGGNKTNSMVQPGSFLMELLESCGLTVVMAAVNVDEIRRCSEMLLEEVVVKIYCSNSIPN